MALIRGTGSTFPCLICLVKDEDLANISAVAALQTSEEMESVFEESEGHNKTKADAILKKYGLSDIEVCELTYIYILLILHDIRMFSGNSSTLIYTKHYPGTVYTHTI